MRQFLCAMVLAWAGLPLWAATYSYSGFPYESSVENCGAQACVFKADMAVKGYLTTREPLAPNLFLAEIRPLVTAYSFTDGVTTYAHDDPQVRDSGMLVHTDASGNITWFELHLQRWQKPPGAHTPRDRVDTLSISGSSHWIGHGHRCASVDLFKDRCTQRASDGATSSIVTHGVGHLAVISEPTVSVFRFYNAKTLAHFFTASVQERDWVRANLPDFNEEGVAFRAHHQLAAGVNAVYRFFNTQTGAHFYTSSIAERDYVLATLKHYRFEGWAWYGMPYDIPGTGGKPVHRFYRPSTETHFYTINQAEMEYVRASDPSFNYEGIAYWAWEAPR